MCVLPQKIPSGTKERFICSLEGATWGPFGPTKLIRGQRTKRMPPSRRALIITACLPYRDSFNFNSIHNMLCSLDGLLSCLTSRNDKASSFGMVCNRLNNVARLYEDANFMGP